MVDSERRETLSNGASEGNVDVIFRALGCTEREGRKWAGAWEVIRVISVNYRLMTQPAQSPTDVFFVVRPFLTSFRVSGGFHLSPPPSALTADVPTSFSPSHMSFDLAGPSDYNLPPLLAALS